MNSPQIEYESFSALPPVGLYMLPDGASYPARSDKESSTLIIALCAELGYESLLTNMKEKGKGDPISAPLPPHPIRPSWRTELLPRSSHLPTIAPETSKSASPNEDDTSRFLGSSPSTPPP